ncbi:MAG: hypothetical protein ACRDG4_05805, partial [Chloroflexota bacterium]
VTQGGHKLTMDDTSGSPTIKVVDSSGNNSLVIDTTSNKITITATGNIELNATQDVKITGMNITLTAQQAFTAEAQGGAAAMKGLTTSVEAQTTGEVRANASQTVQAQGQLSLTSSGVTQVQGSVIQLN